MALLGANHSPARCDRWIAAASFGRRNYVASCGIHGNGLASTGESLLSNEITPDVRTIRQCSDREKANDSCRDSTIFTMDSSEFRRTTARLESDRQGNETR